MRTINVKYKEGCLLLLKLKNIKLGCYLVNTLYFRELLSSSVHSKRVTQKLDGVLKLLLSPISIILSERCRKSVLWQNTIVLGQYSVAPCWTVSMVLYGSRVACSDTVTPLIKRARMITQIRRSCVLNQESTRFQFRRLLWYVRTLELTEFHGLFNRLI